MIFLVSFSVKKAGDSCRYMGVEKMPPDLPNPTLGNQKVERITSRTRSGGSD